MIKYPSFSYTRLLFFVLLITGLSCKKSFDNPPGYTPPNVTANTTIKDLKALHSSGNFEQITEDKIIQGIVVADDKSGNFFLNIVIQDETGGITIRLDGIGLFSSYPVGRQVFIKCRGLYLNDYNGLIQLGGGVDNTGTAPALTTIASALIDSFVIKGSTGNVVNPKVVTLDDLSTDLQDPYLNTLIQLDGFQFADVDLGSTYADPTKTVSAINYDIENCSGNSIILRNSSYANFAGQTLPSGNGSIVAVYSVFRTDRQLLIRDTSDINFTGDRCTGGGGGTGGGTGQLISIAALRAMYTGTNDSIGSYKVGGIVISDAANKNISGGNVVLQSGNAGILVFMGGTLSYNIGDSIVLDLTNADSLINYKGSLEIKTRFGFVKPAALATGIVITPQTKTISEINAALSLPLGDAANFEFTLLKIVGATATPAGDTYSGSKTLTDATGSITLFTSGSATFKGDPLPTGSKTFVGYPLTFNGVKEFEIRNTGDVQ